MDVHKYLDIDNSGEHAECTTDNILDAFAVVAAFLRENGRQALVSETGSGSSSSVRNHSTPLNYHLTLHQCFTDFCAQNTFLNQNSDVFLGYIAWAAGSFSPSYVLSLTPTKKNGKYVDNDLASQCVVAPWLNAGSEIVTSAVASSVLVVTTSGPEKGDSSTTASGVVSTDDGRTVTMTKSSQSPVPFTTGEVPSTAPGGVKSNATSGVSSSTGSGSAQPTAGANPISVWRVLFPGCFFAAAVLNVF